MTALFSATRLLTSFAVVIGAYWLYALLMVPLVEPEAKLRKRSGSISRTFNSGTSDRYRDLLVRLFPSSAWERSSPKILETDQGLLLFRDHKPLKGGEIEVFPFTVVLRSDDDRRTAPAEQTGTRPIVLKAADGATLAFDKKLDLTRGDMGKLERARLRGEITIYGPESEPGANDELHVVTHNVHIDQQRVVTRHDVSFRLGPHYGSGRNLTIDLLPKQESNPQEARRQFGNVKLLELVHVDKINLRLKSGGLMGRRDSSENGPGPTDSAESSEQNVSVPRAPQPVDPPTPVEITCRGPFQFDFVNSVASFEDHVNVVAIHPEGPADQLNCQLLEVYLASRERQSVNASAVPPANDDGGGLDVRRLVAVGHPVTMRVPSRQAEAVAQRLDYDVATKNIKLTAPDKVSLKHDADQVEAHSVDYTIAENNRLGSLVAKGPGWILHRGKKENAAFTARWNRLLDMQPRDGRHVVSILGKAQLGLEGMGQINADEIFMWLLEVPKDTVDRDHRNPTRAGEMPDENSRELDQFAESEQHGAVSVPPTGTDGSREGSKVEPRTQVLPDKLLARGNVTVESPQLSARTRKLEAWFKQANPDRAAAELERAGSNSRLALGANPLTQQAGSGAENSEKQPPKKRQKFDLTGDLIRAKLLQVGGRTEISGVDVAGNVKLVEIDGFGPGQVPLQINGDVLQFVPNKDKLAKVSVVGKPAHVAARGLVMRSGRVNLDQATNRMWIDRAGEMTLPAQRPKPRSKSAVPQLRMPPLRDSHVSWSGRMQFDGRTVHFEKDVVFRGEHLLESGEVVNLNGRSQTLDVALMQPVSFSKASKDRREKTKIRQIALQGGVYMENHGRDEYRLRASMDRLSTRNLIIDYYTGEIRADGRGWVKSVRRGNDRLTRRAAGRPAAAANPEGGNGGLVFVHVTFDNGITGDVFRREVNFHQNVEAIYGPVANWDDELDPTRRGGLGRQGVTLNCDKLTVAEMGPKIEGRRSLELTATGNTHIEGERFEAIADRVSFAEAKSVVVLEGTNRVNAELWHQHRIGAQRDHAAARKILYWRDDNRVEVEDARFLDLTRGGMSFRPRSNPRR